MQALIDWIASTSLSERILTEFWIVPNVQSVHICAIAVLVGSALMTELRLAGVLATDEAPATVIKRYLPWLWGALAVLLLTGLILIWGEPERTLLSRGFWLKMSLVLIGFLLTVFTRRPLLTEPESNRPAWSIKPVAWLSLCIWIAVVCFGRWIAYGA
jgi:hypothetical protein